MKKFIIGAGIALLLAVAFPAGGLAADAWLLDTSLIKAKVTATLTYTDLGLGKAVTVKYRPGPAKVRIERDTLTGKHTASVVITQGAENSLSLSAGMLGSGLKVVNSTTLVAGINPTTDTDTPFAFIDNVPYFQPGLFHAMSAANVMASSAEGKFDEVIDKATGLPSGNINLSLTYTIVGNLDTTDAFAKIVVQVSAKNVPPDTNP
jgi:hypothetical protein